jgi:uncharacterized protein (TIGR02302 family)
MSPDGPPSSEKKAAARGLTARLGLARLALLWEKLWPALWPAAGVAGFFLALALFDVPAMLPGWAQAALLGIAALLVLGFLVKAAWRFHLPSRHAAQRRVETASGLSHRPLSAIADKLAGDGNDTTTRSLWQAHQARMATALRRLKIGQPRAGLLRHDPYGLRAALALILLVAAIDAGGDWRLRVERAFHPDFALFGSTSPIALDIWIDPPQYTGLPPQFLATRSDDAPVAVPVGSTVLAQVHGGSATPGLAIDGNTMPMTKIDAGEFKGHAIVAAGSRLAVNQGWHSLGSWPITVIPDHPPRIAFAKPPQASARGALRLEYRASDDYGVEAVKAVITRPDDPSGETIALDLPLPDQHAKEAQGVGFNDLTPHPWAGMKVRIELIATDALGQTGHSDIVETVLPERTYRNPVARAIVDQRKELAAHPDGREGVAEILADLSARPGLYNDDLVAFLALRTASDRLVLDRDTGALPAVSQLLWDTAVRIEDGRAADSQNDLRQSMQALQDALARNAPQAEIERLLQELQQQIDRYLQALAQQGQQGGAQNQPADPSQTLSGQDLKNLLDRAREMARTGARDQARDMLAQLQDLLENLRAGKPGPMRSGQAQSLGAMQDMMHRQQQLLDRSFRQSRGVNPSGQNGAGQGAPGGDAEQQESLRQALSEMMKKLGQQSGAPGAMERAQRAMQDAVNALKQGRSGDAIGPQTEALDALQQAARALTEQMLGDANGNDLPSQRDMALPRRDPFGRLSPDMPESGGIDDGGDMRLGKSASDSAMEHAKAILDELRRRSGERQRPALERDYIDRLLQQF